jgi:predicted transcriptional regulator
MEIRSISRNGNAIIRRSIRFSKEELQLVLEQSRRLLLEVAIEQQQQQRQSMAPRPMLPPAPNVKRCSTEMVDEGYISEEENGKGTQPPLSKMAKTESPSD